MMTNRRWIVGVCWSVLAGWPLVGSALARVSDPPEAPGRPNIVFICLEGLAGSSTGFGGHPAIKTPHLDQLAARSFRFTRAYTPMPQSAGARASMLTGQHPHRHGVTDDETPIPGHAITFSSLLENAGYKCGLVGTWRLPEMDTPVPDTPMPQPQAQPAPTPAPSSVGLMHPPERPLPAPKPKVFDERHPEGQPPVEDLPQEPAERPAKREPRNGSGPPSSAGSQPATATAPGPAESRPAATAPATPAVPPPPPPVAKPGHGFTHSVTSDLGGPLEQAKVYINGKQETADKYLPDWHVDQAVQFIEEPKDGPFLLCLFLPGPPEPLTYPPGDENRYPPGDLPLPPVPKLNPKNTPNRLRNTALIQKCPKQPEVLRHNQSQYYSFVSRIDDNIGRIIQALADAGLDENTWVVLTADQGFATGANGAWGTGPAFWEEIIRCPLLIRPPGDQAVKGVEIDRVVGLASMAPTIVELAGLAPPLTMQVRSLVTLMRRGEDRYHADECFIQYERYNNQPFPVRAVVADQYKLVDYLQDADQFYDLKRDPAESQNLVDDYPYAAMVKVLRSRLDHWRKRTRDTGK